MNNLGKFPIKRAFSTLSYLVLIEKNNQFKQRICFIAMQIVYSLKKLSGSKFIKN